MQKRSRNMNTYICLYLHHISRIDKKLIEMFICVVTTQKQGRIGRGFSLFLFIYRFIFKFFLKHANIKEGGWN